MLDDQPSFTFANPDEGDWQEDFARWTDNAVNFAVGAPAPPAYIEPDEQHANAWPELVRARAQGLSQITLRSAPDGSPVINAAAPVGLNGASLLTTRNAVDITAAVRAARAGVLTIIALSLIVSVILSLYLANTIIQPLRRLVRATVLVRTGREREVEVPRMQERGDEIGLLARAVSDMTAALRHRIDAVESFAADVAHEIKNPLASLRSATESLPKLEDEDLRAQLVDVAAHDVQRIDRLVTEISEASRVDAEISRTRFEPVDIAKMFSNIVKSREDRSENEKCSVVVDQQAGICTTMGVPLRLERIAENLLDNAVSFSPDGGEVEVIISREDDRIIAKVCDQGPGIPESEREKVFRRFHSDRPEASFGNHSGLGLNIARSIAEAHDGTLFVTDRPDGQPGACLVLDLPVA